MANLVIDFRIKELEKCPFYFGIEGNNHSDTITFITPFTSEYLDYVYYLKLADDKGDYVDLISIIYGKYITEDGYVAFDWSMSSKSSSHRRLKLQVEIQNNDKSYVNQSRIAFMVLEEYINALETMPDVYPTIIEQLVAGLQQEIMDRGNADTILQENIDASGHSISMSYNNYVLTLNLLDGDGNIISTQSTTLDHDKDVVGLTYNNDGTITITYHDRTSGTLDLSGIVADTLTQAQMDAINSGINTTKVAKLNNIEANAQVNVLEGVQVNGIDLAIANKKVNVSVPTKTSDITNDGDGTSNFATQDYVDNYGGKIDSISIDGATQTITNKNVDLPAYPTKTSLGLENVVNSGDSDTPVENGTTKFTTGGAYTELNKKVDKVAGKELSTNDFTNALKTKLNGIEDNAQVNIIESVKVNNSALTPTNKAVNIDLTPYALIQNMETYAKDLVVSIDSDYVVSFVLKDKNGNTLANQSVDLPLETMVVGGSYDSTNKEIVLELDNGQTIEIPVADLVNGLVSTSDLNTALASYYTKTQADNLLDTKVDKVVGKGLSENDFTDSYKGQVDSNTTARHTHSNKAVLDDITSAYTTEQASKLSGIESGAEVNVIEDIKVNSVSQTITSKSVDISVPTKTSELQNNGEGYNLDSKFTSTTTDNTFYGKNTFDGRQTTFWASGETGIEKNRPIFLRSTSNACQIKFSVSAYTGEKIGLLSAVVPTNKTIIALRFNDSSTTHNIAYEENIPTKVSDLTNDSGYLTSSALSGYATETWVQQQGYATTTWVGQQGYITSSALTPYIQNSGNSSLSGTFAPSTDKGASIGDSDKRIYYLYAYRILGCLSIDDPNGNRLSLPTKSGTIATTSDIPTNNNQLTNGAGYITASALGTQVNYSYDNGTLRITTK